jgi:uracil-DNA glycosylase
MDPQPIDFDAEIADLTEEMGEWADRQADAPFNSDAAKRMEYEARQVERLRQGVAWAQQTFDDGLVIRPLTDGARNAIDDIVQETAFKRYQAVVCVGTVAAPYLEHDPDEISPSSDDVRATLRNITELDPRFVDWVADRIQTLGSMEDELGNSYTDMLLAKRREKASPEQSGSDTAES